MTKEMAMARKLLIERNKESYIAMYKKDAVELLKTAQKYFADNSAEEYFVLNLPNTSKDFWNVLKSLADSEEFGFFVQRIWLHFGQIKVWKKF